MKPPCLDPIGLDAYCNRIGYRGDRTPTLATLRSIHYAHATTIPFENLNPLLQQPVRLDLASLQQKLIDQHRGGYCFEQNALLRSALLAMGFSVTSLAARVLWNQPAGTITPRSHMLLYVAIEGIAYIADVGFGGLTLTAPLRLQPDLEQKTPHEPFRLIGTTGSFVMQAWLNQDWKPLYRFDLQEQQLPDYEVSNWYVSTHPDSLFVNALLAARPDPIGRYALLNNQFTTHFLDGRTERQQLGTVAELRQVLEERFLVRLPEHPQLDQVLQQFIQSSADAPKQNAAASQSSLKPID